MEPLNKEVVLQIRRSNCISNIHLEPIFGICVGSTVNLKFIILHYEEGSRDPLVTRRVILQKRGEPYYVNTTVEILIKE